MAITYSLAPEPFWYIVNDVGTAAGGAQMFTRRSLNHDDPKPVYQDAGGTTPWTNPIIFNENGVAGPFYWEFDSNNPDELYYIFIKDADGTDLWSINNFSGGTGGGGGGNVTTYLPLTNYIANNQFIDHIDATTTTSITNLVIAPSNHKGFTPADVTPIVGTNGVFGPDIRFLKNSTANTDNISFPLFAFASAPLNASDVTPVDYVRYQCTTSNAGETYKCFQFPITQKVKNLSNQVVTFDVWAASGSGTPSLQLYVRQYFGQGAGASTEVRNSVGAAIPLTVAWTRFRRSFTVPDVASKSLGTLATQTDDDALYLQLQMPLGAVCDVFFTKPALYLGDISPNADFETYDQINSIDSTPRTGDIKVGFSTIAPGGWVAMNDGSIGSSSSGATTRANKDTFQLYKTLWDGVVDTWAPVSTGRGASAVADFQANKTLTLPRSLGRALAGAGTGAGLTARILGEYLGEETHVLTIPEIPAHTHTIPNLSVTNVTSGSGRNAVSAGTNNTGSTGGDGAHNNMQPTSFMNVYIKL